MKRRDAPPPLTEHRVKWALRIVESFRARGEVPDSAVLDELVEHVEELWRSSIAAGGSEEEAGAAVDAELADLSRHATRLAGTPPLAAGMLGRNRWSSGLMHDVRHAIRQVAAQRAFSAGVAVTLALGVGVAAAVLSLSAAVLLTPLPFPDSGRLVMLHATNSAGGFANELSYLDVEDIRRGIPPFEGVAAALRYSATIVGGSEPVQVRGYEVTPDFLDVLRVRLSSGRGFLPDESDAPVAILSHALWTNMFGADPSVTGRQVKLDDTQHTVVGVLPADFSLDLGWSIDLLVPTSRAHPLARSRAIRAYQAVARLSPDATLEQVRAALETKARQLAAAYPETNARRQFTAVPLLDEVVGEVRTPLRLMSYAVGAVLLLVCANVANLLLTRVTWRRRELSVRAALGAGRGRLVRQMLTESLLLSAVGGAGGCVLAWWMHALLARSQGASIPRLDAPMGLPLAASAIGLTLLAGLAVGLVPAWLASRPAPADVLRDARSTPAGSAVAIGRGLVILQTAAALVLVSAAAVLATSLLAVLRAPAGFDAKDTVTMRVALPPARYPTRAAIAAFFTTLTDETRRLPSVRHAGVASALPLSGQDSGSALSIYGRPLPLDELPTVRWQMSAPGYFTAMGIPILRGRDSSAEDLARPHVSIVSEALAQQFFPGQSAVGQRIYCGLPSENHADWHEIIGVVGDVRHRRLDLAPEPRVYDLLGQHADYSAFLVVRAPEPAVVSQVRAVIRALDPELAVSEVSTLEDMASRSVAPRRFLMVLVSAAALLAVVIAAVGVYGMMAYNVARRRHELGVRLALGAAPRDLIRMVAGQGLWLALAGSVAGAAAAALLAPVLAAQVYGAGRTRVAALAGGALLLVLVATAASYLPARRAARVDPLVTLRDT
jgi:predicted permease